MKRKISFAKNTNKSNVLRGKRKITKAKSVNKEKKRREKKGSVANVKIDSDDKKSRSSAVPTCSCRRSNANKKRRSNGRRRKIRSVNRYRKS